MNDQDSILRILFYGLVGIVIFAIIRNVCPEYLWMPMFVLVASVLWILYDFVVQKRVEQKPIRVIWEEDEEVQDAEILEEPDEEPSERPVVNYSENYRENRIPPKFANHQPMIEGHVMNEGSCIAQHNNEFDIDIARGEPISALFQRSGSNADNAIANRMKYMGMQPKLSMEIRARHNRHTMQPYFEEELAANERREWWNNENDYLDAFM